MRAVVKVAAYNLPLGTRTAAKLRQRIRQVLTGVVLFAGGATVLTFAVDFGLFRMRVAANRSPYDAVVVSHFYAVAQKNGKTQFIFEPPAPENCVNALFPHSGMRPCWYLRRHPEQRTDI